MTVVFRIGENGNGTAYSGRSQREIDKLVKDYEQCGWKVTYISQNTGTDIIWYQID